MSYDVDLVADLGGAEPVALGILDVNYTYNCGAMLADAADGVWLNDMDGWDASRVADLLDLALRNMEADPDHFRAMNPENGWGDFDGWRRFLGEIRDACRIAPDARLRVT